MSLIFRPAQLSDRAKYVSHFGDGPVLGCEYAFGNVFAWSAGYDTSLAEFEDTFIVRAGLSEYSYSVPVGLSDVRSALTALFELDAHVKMHCLTNAAVNAVESAFPGEFEFTPIRSSFDYIYLQSELATLPGRRFHKKKNHFSSFEKTYSYRLEAVDSSNVEECLAFSNRWSDANIEKNPAEISEEKAAVNKALSNWSALGLTGALIRVDGEIVAYCAGEELTRDTFCTHFEKALPEFNGAYAAINKLFAQEFLGAYKYVNREEDTGDEGLRQAKLSYQPCTLLEKYNAVRK